MTDAADTLLAACPPRDLDVEAAALGAMLLDSDALAVGRRELLKDDFTEQQNVLLFSALCEVTTRLEPDKRLDLPVLEAALRVADMLDAVGGRARLLTLADSCGSASNIGAYAKILRDKTALRQLRDAAAETLRLAAKPDTRPRKIIRLLTRAAEKAARRAAGESEATETPVLTCLQDVEARKVPWLWERKIPLARLTLLVARPGEGKTFVGIDLAARISTGTPLPDGSPCPKGSVILICGEDDPHDTLRPRLDAHRADCTKIHLLTMVRRVDEKGKPYEVMFTLQDVEALEAALKMHPDCKLVVVDPIGSFVGGDTDTHRDNEVRSVLAPVAKLAEVYGPAVLILAHRRKSSATNADDLALGSRAFTGLCRAVWHISRDADNQQRRLFLPGKNNLAPESGGLAFTIDGDPPTVIWEHGGVAMRADDALANENEDSRPGPEPEARNAAVDWLRRLLAAGPVPSGNLRDPAPGTIRALAKEADFRWATIRRAADALGVRREVSQFTGLWQWRLPTSTNPLAQDAPLIGTT